MFIGQKVLERTEEKTTEMATILRGLAHHILLQEAPEKGLNQILRVVMGLTSAADIKVKRSPVGAEESAQSGVNDGDIGFASSQYNAPVRAWKVPRTGRSRQRPKPRIFGWRHGLKVTRQA